MTAKKATKKKDPNLCTFIGGHSDGVELVIVPGRTRAELPYTVLVDDEYIDDGVWGLAWHRGGCISNNETYIRVPRTNTFLSWREYGDDPRLAWYRIEKLEAKLRLLMDDINNLNHTKQTRWFHRR